MPGLEPIYLNLGSLINRLIREEFDKQGHTLTGSFSRSLDSKISKTILTGYAEGYGKIVNEGIQPQDVSEKMLPGLIKYFQLRGFDENSAKKFATLTFHKWKKEGVSTEASSRFSQTGERHHFIDRALENPAINIQMSLNFDNMVEGFYRQTKSETI